MEFPNLIEGTSFLFSLCGLGFLGGFIEYGEGFICSIGLIVVGGLLAICAKIGDKNKRK